MAITKTVSKVQYSVVDVISYVVKIMNNGQDIANKIYITEIKDDSLAFKSFFAISGYYDNEKDVWHFNSLSNGERTSFHFDAISNKKGWLIWLTNYFL